MNPNRACGRMEMNDLEVGYGLKITIACAVLAAIFYGLYFLEIRDSKCVAGSVESLFTDCERP